LNNYKDKSTILPLGQVFLSGVFTGMVTTITLVRFLLYYRLLQTMLEFNCKNKLGLVNTREQSMQPKIFIKNTDWKGFTLASIPLF